MTAFSVPCRVIRLCVRRCRCPKSKISQKLKKNHGIHHSGDHTCVLLVTGSVLDRVVTSIVGNCDRVRRGWLERATLWLILVLRLWHGKFEIIDPGPDSPWVCFVVPGGIVNGAEERGAWWCREIMGRLLFLFSPRSRFSRLCSEFPVKSSHSIKRYSARHKHSVYLALHR